MKEITEKDKEDVQWYKDAKNQTLETLPDFINHLVKDYSHDYGTICRQLLPQWLALVMRLIIPIKVELLDSNLVASCGSL